jgi:anti-sigma B factor antagonist
MDELTAGDEDPPVSFSVAPADDSGTARVEIGGELDMSSIPELEEMVDPVLAARPRRLVVDVSELRFADSSAIALWVKWAGSVPSFELQRPPELIRRVIVAMGLAERLEVSM